MQTTSPIQEVVALRRECDNLRARLRHLEHLFGDDVILPIDWRLRGDEAAMVTLLFRRKGGATYDAIVEAVWSRIGRDEPLSPRNTINVHVCNIRKKLAAVAGGIETQWGVGLRLNDAARRAIEAVNPGERS